MPTEITPLNAPLGACVRGTRLKGNYYPNDFQTIQQALLDHHLLLFPDQDITEAEQVGFSGLFGELEIQIVPLLSVGACPQQNTPCKVLEFCK